MLLHDFLDYRGREQPEAEFAVHGDRRLTYGEAVAEVNRLANALIAAGLAPGDRLAVLSKNSVAYVLLYYAASKAGVVPVPLNYRSATPEWVYIINDSGAKLLVAAAPFLSALDGVRGDLPLVERWVAVDGPESAGWASLRRLMADQPAVSPERRVAEDDDLYQLYTSGTTGRPKGAELTQRAVTANVTQIALSPHAGTPGERSLVVAPLCHAAAVWTAFSPVAWGGSLYILEDFDPLELVRVLSEERIGYAVLVPTIIQACLVAVPDLAERDYAALRLIHCGSAPLAEQTLRRAVAAFRCDFVHAYGMTETTAAVAMMSPADTRHALADRPELLLSAGRPFVGTELRVVDDRDAPVPSGTVGEIVVRGPQLMRGYWRQPEASAEALRGGWMHTGDAGTLDEDGYLYIRDRLKDMIVSGGVNVYPRMVENVLFEHPAVADVAVIGVPDERWGETVKALVVRRPGMAVSEQELIDFCRGRLGGYQRPRSVDFLDALPRTATGKVLKRAVREPYWRGHERRVAGA